MPTSRAETASVLVVSVSTLTVPFVKRNAHSLRASSKFSTRWYSCSTSFRVLKIVSLDSSGRSSANFSKREACRGSFFCTPASGEKYLCRKVRKPSAVNRWRSASRSGSWRRRSWRPKSSGTSVRMVARYFEKRICSSFSVTFFLSEPVSSSLCSRRSSTLPKRASSFCAVFSPTPGQPGMCRRCRP